MLANDGTVHCWGDCPKCCAGAPAIGLPPAKAIVGQGITCALSRDGEVFCLQRSPGQKREDGTVVKAYEFENVDSGRLSAE